MASRWHRLLETVRWNLSRHRASTFLSVTSLSIPSFCFALPRFASLGIASSFFPRIYLSHR